ncbi:MAG TPA: FoF1 ATP synthase subunit gamma [Patescibacteria group bacterium]|nr:FoF1 ATP synthase subunit gamma [Patescibacteria group bacterium]
MTTKKAIEGEIENLTGIKTLVETYKEIAASRIRRTRTSVVKTRDFLSQLNEIFQEVIASYQKQIEQMMKAKRISDPSKLSVIKRNGKTVLVFMSANTGLFGDIVKRTFDLFIQEALRTNSDTVIIGKIGLGLLQESNYKGHYTYFDCPDHSVDDKVLGDITKTLVQYEKIVVYYEHFENLVEQTPSVTDISGNPMSYQEDNRPKDVVRFLFEPSLEEILTFFETEFFTSILEQTIRESQLAKFSSRMVALDTVSENIRKEIIKSKILHERAKHREENSKQNQTFSSMVLWK